MLKTVRMLNKQDRQNRSILVPKTVQDLIPVDAIYEGGIFRHGQNKYSMCYAFDDINFCIAADKDQESMFYTYEDIINSFDVGSEVKITINNRTLDRERFASDILVPDNANDDLGKDREEYNTMLLDKAKNSNNIIQERYITISVFKDSLDEARTYFNRIYTDLNIHFTKLGSGLREIKTEERLKIFYSFLRPGEDELFAFDFKARKNLGHSFKDYICPDSIELIDDKTIKFGDKYARVLFLKDYASYINPSILPEFTGALKKNLMLSIDNIMIPTEEAIKETETRLLGAEANISKWTQKQVDNKNFSSVVPPQLRKAREELEEFLNDLTSRDQKMLLSVLTIVHVADTVAELNEDTETLRNVAGKNRCQLAVLRWMQIAGLSTCLPWGVRQLPVDCLRTLSTEALASFMPFYAQDVLQANGEYFGQNAINKNLVVVNRENFKNGNSWILGVPGSGKSFAAKESICSYMLGTDSDIIIIDPDREYGNLVKHFKGETIVLSPTSEHHINALDLNENYADGQDPIVLKSNFIISLCEQALKDKKLSAIDTSIIDRCTKIVYADFVKNNYRGTCPTLLDFYECLLAQPEEEAHDLALALEMFTKGSMNTFAKQTNVNSDNRLICYDLNELTGSGDQLARLGMLIMLDSILNRLTANRAEHRNTYIFVDEVYLLFQYSYAADFFFKLWKRIRKYGGFCIGITQNVTDLLQSHTAETMLSNSEIVLMFSQAPNDIVQLQELLGISDVQANYMQNVPSGHGLLKVGKNLIPIVNEFPTDTGLYKLMTTKLKEVED